LIFPGSKDCFKIIWIKKISDLEVLVKAVEVHTPDLLLIANFADIATNINAGFRIKSLDGGKEINFV